jgi:hypothetical protein
MNDADQTIYSDKYPSSAEQLPVDENKGPPSPKTGGLRVGVVHWRVNNMMVTGILRAVVYLDHEAVKFHYDARLPSGLDAVIICGPFGTMAPLIKQLAACPKSQRPLLVYIMTEQLPNPSLPEWWRRASGAIRSRLDRLAYQEDESGQWKQHPWLKHLASSSQRYRYYGDLLWMKRQGILSVLALSSLWTADFLRARGFDPMILPPSVIQGEDLKLERDIPVLWLGKTGSSRRANILKQIRSDLKARGVDMMVIDGVENPYVFGDQRTILLNRAKIVLNVLREKWDDNSMRYVLAAPCRALIVTEPTLCHSPFLPGVHLVEAPLPQLADTICHYLTHEEERLQITERAYQLIMQESGLDKMRLILERLCAMRQSTYQ